MIIREKQEKKNEKKIEEWAKSKKFAFKGMHTAQFLFLCHNRNEKKRNKKTNKFWSKYFSRIMYYANLWPQGKEAVPKGLIVGGI